MEFSCSAPYNLTRSKPIKLIIIIPIPTGVHTGNTVSCNDRRGETCFKLISTCRAGTVSRLEHSCEETSALFNCTKSARALTVSPVTIVLTCDACTNSARALTVSLVTTVLACDACTNSERALSLSCNNCTYT
jgi:hypothetical protein